jgi:hypothetical protein
MTRNFNYDEKERIIPYRICCGDKYCYNCCALEMSDYLGEIICMFYGRLKTTKDGKERLRDPECIKNAILKEDEK